MRHFSCMFEQLIWLKWLRSISYELWIRRFWITNAWISYSVEFWNRKRKNKNQQPSQNESSQRNTKQKITNSVFKVWTPIRDSVANTKNDMVLETKASIHAFFFFQSELWCVKALMWNQTQYFTNRNKSILNLRYDSITNSYAVIVHCLNECDSSVK